MAEKVSKFIYWAPRVLSIMFILFLALFSLDVFEGNYGFWGTILAFLMHNIPVFILIGILIISWKYEIVGGIAFTLAGILYIVLISIKLLNEPTFQWYYLSYSLIIAGPAFFIGALFFLGWFQKKQ